eukprot:gene18639-20520_t
MKLLVVSYILMNVISRSAVTESIVIQDDLDNEPVKNGGEKEQQKLLLISLDGLRWDMISKNRALFPHITKLQRLGVWVKDVENVFPTNTFPNHYSIVTGLYPESHGIVDNEMLNMETGEKFSMKSREPKWWNEAEPIWVTNQKQGHSSAVLHWPGFNVRIRGLLPSHSSEINSSSGVPLYEMNKGKIDLTLEWLQEPSVTFAAVYFEEFDKLSHDIGDHDVLTQQNDTKNKYKIEKMKQVFKDTDKTMAYLKEQLELLNMDSRVNVIFIGDHGHTGVTHKKIIRLNDYIDVNTDIRDALGMTFVSVFPKAGQLSTVYDELRNAHAHMKVHLKEDLPSHMHIKENKRTAPLLLLADPGWLIDAGIHDYYTFRQDEFERGEHGYSHLFKNMHPGFFAFGPCFKHGKEFNKIRMVDIYPLMCELLHIKPRPNNGSLDRMTKLLNKDCLTRLVNEDGIESKSSV